MRTPIEPKIIEMTTIELNETPSTPKEIKSVHIWCDGKNHSAMIVVDEHYEFGGTEKCDCQPEGTEETSIQCPKCKKWYNKFFYLSCPFCDGEK